MLLKGASGSLTQRNAQARQYSPQPYLGRPAMPGTNFGTGQPVRSGGLSTADKFISGFGQAFNPLNIPKIPQGIAYTVRNPKEALIQMLTTPEGLGGLASMAVPLGGAAGAAGRLGRVGSLADRAAEYPIGKPPGYWGLKNRPQLGGHAGMGGRMGDPMDRLIRARQAMAPSIEEHLASLPEIPTVNRRVSQSRPYTPSDMFDNDALPGFDFRGGREGAIHAMRDPEGFFFGPAMGKVVESKAAKPKMDAGDIMKYIMEDPQFSGRGHKFIDTILRAKGQDRPNFIWAEAAQEWRPESFNQIVSPLLKQDLAGGRRKLPNNANMKQVLLNRLANPYTNKGFWGAQ